MNLNKATFPKNEVGKKAIKRSAEKTTQIRLKCPSICPSGICFV